MLPACIATVALPSSGRSQGSPGETGLGVIKDELETRLRAALAPVHLVVRDDSARHEGHAGHRPEGETHFFVDVVSERFAGASRVARQRLVFDAVGDLMQRRIHALSIRARTPAESAAG